MRIEEIELEGVVWKPQALARIWIAQPLQRFPREEPYSPTPGALDLLRSILSHEQGLEAPIAAPAIVVMPELSLRYEDIPAVRGMLSAARPNTLLISGVAQLTEGEAQTIEEGAELWDGASEDRYTNCAIIGCGGSARLYLQPKRVASQWEKKLWPGAVVRYFTGDHLGFSVVICSELLDQVEGKHTIFKLREELGRLRKELRLLFWIQHNPDPRSSLFNESLGVLADWENVTTVIAASRPEDSHPRRKNHAVSGALVPPRKIPSEFKFLDAAFHYVEPCPPPSFLSRFVLLRYDADAYRVDTVLASHIPSSVSSAMKSAIFDSARPYVNRGGTLVHSNDNNHLRELTRAATEEVGRGDFKDVATRVQDLFVGIGTERFLAFLDRAMLPKPAAPDDWHAAGTPHAGGDARCRCWEHRICLDSLEGSGGFQEVMECLTLIRASGVDAAPDIHNSCNVSLTVDESRCKLRVVSAESRDADAVARALHPGRPPTEHVPLLITGTRSRGWRPKVSSILAGRVAPSGNVNQARATAPQLQAKYGEDLVEAFEKGSVPELIAELCSV